ncbi:MAG: DNA internalization-related competence protein ComEC/Rec2 [Candidatus Tectomicrobia bacterium]|nr:DNA internalization-related competence protein ComEC/Rec2 [Candidatus Tectomicrobia bacterium]
MLSDRTLAGAVSRLEPYAVKVWRRPLLCVAAGLLGGGAVNAAVGLTAPWLLVAMAAMGLGLLPRWSCQTLQWCCRVAFLGAAIVYLHLGWLGLELPPEHVSNKLPERPERWHVEGVVDRAVESLGDRQRVYLSLRRLQRPGQPWEAARGVVRINVHTGSLPYFPGDLLRVSRVRLHRPRTAGNPGAFDFRALMRRRGIYAVGGVTRAERLHLLGRVDGYGLARLLERWRQRIRSAVASHLSSPNDAMFLSIVLGERGALSAQMQSDFRTAGVAHLLVVSGLHVGFVAGASLLAWRYLLRELRARLPRDRLPGWRPTPLAATLSLPPVLLYCSLVGWRVPTLRAALMVGCYMLSLCTERRSDARYALMLAAVLIVLLDPRAFSDVGFRLSFAAVASILLASGAVMEPAPSPSGAAQRTRRYLAGYVTASVAAYLGTLPILMEAFRTAPTFGVITNLLVLPLVGVLVPAGVLALALMAAWPAAAPAVFSPLDYPFSWLLTLTEWIADLPNALVHTASPSALTIAAYYALFAGLLFAGRRQTRLRCVGVCLLVLLSSIAWQVANTRTDRLLVTFLDVGTGDAILVQVPGNHNLLIDGGGTYDGRFDVGARVVAPVLLDRHIRRLDLVALTHPHPNHARGLVSLVELFPTEHLLTNGTPMREGYPRDILAAGERWDTRHHTAPDGRRAWHWGDLRLTVLSPPDADEQARTSWNPESENDRSLVLLLQYGEVRILLTGDIQRLTESWLLTHREALRADVMQVPHHGSKTSTTPDFVRRVQPRDGIISLGAGNYYGHPHPRVLETLHEQNVRVWRTDIHGAVTVSTDGSTYEILTHGPAPNEE